MKSHVGSCSGSASWEQLCFMGSGSREAGCGELPCVAALAARHALQTSRVPRGSGPLPGTFSRPSLWSLLSALPFSLRPSHAVSACSVGLLTREGIRGVPGERCVQASGGCVSVSLGQVLGQEGCRPWFPALPAASVAAAGPSSSSCFLQRGASALPPGLRALLRREARAFPGARTLFQPASLSQPHQLPVPARPACPASTSCYTFCP